MLCLYRWRTWDSDTTLLSSLMASSTINRLGLFFCFRIAVDKSSALELGEKTQLMSLSDTGPVQPPPVFISTSYKSLCCLVFHKLYLFVAQRRTLLPRDQLQEFKGWRFLPEKKIMSFIWIQLWSYLWKEVVSDMLLTVRCFASMN